jgi:hypothetical protein
MLLDQRGARRVDCADTYVGTMLIQACRDGRRVIAHLLLQARAKARAVDAATNTAAAFAAVRHGHYHVALGVMSRATVSVHEMMRAALNCAPPALIRALAFLLRSRHACGAPMLALPDAGNADAWAHFVRDLPGGEAAGTGKCLRRMAKELSRAWRVHKVMGCRHVHVQRQRLRRLRG